MPFILNHPHPFAIVDQTLLIAGFGTAFEGVARVAVDEGHDGVDEPLSLGGTGTVAEFHAELDLSGLTFTLPTLMISIYEPDAGSGRNRQLDFRRVFYGPRIMADSDDPGATGAYSGYFIHTVAAGDTLFGIASDAYGDGSEFHRIVNANAHMISDPDVISIGQELRIPT